MLDPHTNPQQEHSFLFNSGPEKKREENTTCDAWRSINYSSRAQKTAQKYKAWKSMGALRNNDKEDDEESGVCSPPLWKSTTTSSRSPPPKSPNFRPNNYQSLSPASRTQAIARGQREMMDMVRNMPESCYELSLKDLVERRPTAMTEAVGRAQADQEEEEEDEILMKREYEDGKLSKNKKKTKKPVVLRRSGSIDGGGFLLKMVFPISLGSKNKKMMNKKNKSDTVVVANSVSAKVSPKPPSAGVDKDWWKKRVSASRSELGRSESGVSSINSGSVKSSGSSSSSCCTSRSSSRHKTGGCLSFILLKKNKRQDKNELS